MDESFLALARKDPLCAAEGLDLASAATALDALQAEVRKFERALAQGSWRMRLYFLFNPVVRTAIPVPFLRALIESERARRAYLADPSLQKERRLKRAWLDAARAYGCGVDAYGRLFELILRQEPALKRKRLYDMGGNSYTAADITADIATWRENAKELLRETYARLRGEGAALADERPAPEPAPLAPLGEPYRLVEEFEDRRVEERYAVSERHGPLAYVLPHFDGAPTARQFVVYFGRNKRTGTPYVWIHLRDKLALLQLVGGRGLGRLTPTIFKPIVERGTRYFSQRLTFGYTLRDQQYMADVLTIVDRARRPELDPALVNTQRSSLFDLLLWKWVDEMQRFIQMVRVRARQHDRGYSMGYSFFTHSNASISFMPYNRSVWRLAPLSMIGSGRMPLEERLYSSLDDIAPSREELLDILSGPSYRISVWNKEGIVLGE